MIRSIICNEVAIRQIIDRLREMFHCRFVSIVAPFVCVAADYAEVRRIFLTIGGASPIENSPCWAKTTLSQKARPLCSSSVREGNEQKHLKWMTGYRHYAEKEQIKSYLTSKNDGKNNKNFINFKKK